MRASNTGPTDNSVLRNYLLGKLTPPEDEEVELRLLSDPSYIEELDITADEIIDAYLAGKLSSDDRKCVELYFLKSATRQDKLGFGRALQRLPKPRVRRWWQNYSLLAASLFVMFGSGLAAWLYFRPTDVDKGLLALNAAYREQRPVEVRLSGLKYAAKANQRGSVKVDYFQRDRASSLLLNAVDSRRDAASHQALGEYYVTERAFEKAIDQLEMALQIDPQNAKIHSDLGAALLEDGRTNYPDSKSGKGAERFAESLQHLNRALSLDKSLAEALFNRALLHGYLMLLPQAEADWRQYLQVDSKSKWADEARTNLKNIEERKNKTSKNDEEIFRQFLAARESGDDDNTWTIVSSNQNRAGNIVVERLIDGYLQKSLSVHPKEADADLAVLSYVGDLAVRKSKDRYYMDLALYYRSLNVDQRRRIQAARGLMKEGHEGWGQVAVAESFSLFDKARRGFQLEGDLEEAKVAGYWSSFSYMRQLQLEQSKQILDALISACEARSYLWLKARCLYQRSALEFRLNQHSKAVDFALQSAALAESIGDAVGLLNAVSSLIEYYRYLGNYQKSLSYIQRALPLLEAIALDPVQGSRHYALSAIAFSAIKHFDAAEAYQTEALRLAQSIKADTGLSYNYAFLGLINGKLGKFEEGLKNIDIAIEKAHPRPNEPANALLIAYASLQKGNIEREMGDCGSALNSYERTIQLYNNQRYTTHIFQAHKGKLFCYISQQENELARQEIATTLGLLDKYREEILEEDNRNTFFDVEQNVYDVAIDFEVNRMNDSERGFTYLQSSQSRALANRLKGDPEATARITDRQAINPVSTTTSLAETRARMLPQTEIVQYAVLEKRLLIWVISTERIELRKSEVAQKDLNDKLLRYLKYLKNPSGGNDEGIQLAKDLYAILVQPVEGLISKNKQICIVPDKTLGFLPFGSLMSSAGKYLIEDYVLSTSRSLNVFLLSSAEASQQGAQPEAELILSVGNPKFDRDAFPDFQDLPAAGREAANVAALYQKRVVLVEDKATVKAVKEQLEHADVIHLAMHSELDEEAPLRSKLILAKSANSESVLYAHEIYNLNLTHTRLVVLSACQTGAEHYYGGEGMASLARIFINAHVPLVVASLWPIDSDATEELMVIFHKHRTRGSTTAEALAQAQREMLRNPTGQYRHPYYWSAFTLTGGYAPF